MAGTMIAMMIFMIVIITATIIFDIFVAANRTPGDTFSEITLKAARNSFFLPAAIGVVIGHLFWPKYGGWDPPGWVTIVSLIAYSGIWLGLDTWLWISPGINNPVLLFIRKYPILLVLASIPIGHFLWPQMEVK